MIFDFNVTLKNLSGEVIKSETGGDQTVGKLLASTLANTNKGNAMKYFGWAQKLWNCETINLDKADKKSLYEFIEQCDTLTNLGKAQILEILDGGIE